MSRKRDPQRRREEIFEVALKCFNQNGYYRTSIDMIAEKMGLTKGAIYWYFKSKEILFIELFRYIVNKAFKEAYESIVTRHITSQELMKLLMKESVAQFIENFEVYKFIIEFIATGVREKNIRRELDNFYRFRIDQYKRIIAGGIENGQIRDMEPDSIAWFLNYLSIGFFMAFLTSDKTADIHAQQKMNIDIFFNGISKN